jgi:hypothetical protein
MDAGSGSNVTETARPQTPPSTSHAEWMPLFSHEIGEFVGSEQWTDAVVGGIRFKVHTGFRYDAIEKAVALLKRFGKPMQAIVFGEALQQEDLSQLAVNEMPDADFERLADMFPPLYIHATEWKTGYRPILYEDPNKIEGTSITGPLAQQLVHAIFVRGAYDRAQSPERDARICYMLARTLAHEVVHSWRLVFALGQLSADDLRLDADGDMEIRSTMFEKVPTPPRGTPYKVYSRSCGGNVAAGEAGRQWENAISNGMCTMDGSSLIFELQEQGADRTKSLLLSSEQISSILEDPGALLDISRRSLPPETLPEQIKRYSSHSGLADAFLGCPGFVPLFQSKLASRG